MTSNDQSAKADKTAAGDAAGGSGGARPLPAKGQVVPSQPKKTAPDAGVTPVKHPPVSSDLLGKAGKTAGMSPRAAAQGKPVNTISETVSDTMPKVTKTPGEQPAAEAAKAQPVPVAGQVRKTGFWPVVLGGVVAAGFGAGATYWAIPHLPQAWQPAQAAVEPVDVEAIKQDILSQLPPAAVSDPAMMQAALSEALDTAQLRFEELAQSAARDEVAKAFAELPSGDDAAPADLAMAVQAQNQRLDELEKRVAEAAPVAVPQPLPGAAASTALLEPGVIETLQTELKALRSQIQEVADRPMPEAGADPAKLDAVAAQVSGMEDALNNIRTQIEAVEGRFSGLVAVAGMTKALGSDGQGREAAVKALEDAGLDQLADLGRNAVSLTDLQDSFGEAATAGLSAARAAAPRSSGLGAVGAFLAEQTQARSIEPREGNDPDAIQSRAGALVASGDIAGALAELGAMPEAAQQAMAGWTDSAKAWVAAQDALDQVTRTESE